VIVIVALVLDDESVHGCARSQLHVLEMQSGDAAGHVTPQPPQFFGSLDVGSSQPFATMPSQLE
jgi:hypothetical protein